MYDLIIVGGGAAGLSASAYALSKGLNILTIYDDLGGKAGTQQHLAGQVHAEYLVGAEAVRNFEHQVVAKAGAVLRDRVTSIGKQQDRFKVDTERHGTKESTAVLVATGASPVKLNVPGASQFLHHGLGYSITTHAHLMDGKTVAVIGTTIRALRGASELARRSVAVFLIAPDPTGLATPLAWSLRKYDNVTVLEGYRVVELVGESSLTEVVVAHDTEERRLKVDAVFCDLGLVPNSGMVWRIARTDRDGFIWIDERNATTMPGLFAAGDVTTSFGEQVLISIGDGARAALSAYDYILAQPAS